MVSTIEETIEEIHAIAPLDINHLRDLINRGKRIPQAQFNNTFALLYNLRRQLAQATDSKTTLSIKQQKQLVEHTIYYSNEGLIEEMLFQFGITEQNESHDLFLDYMSRALYSAIRRF